MIALAISDEDWETIAEELADPEIDHLATPESVVIVIDPFNRKIVA